MLVQEFSSPGIHTRVTLHREAVGWQICEERNGRVIAAVHCTDWHRVERALRLIELENRATSPASGLDR